MKGFSLLVATRDRVPTLEKSLSSRRRTTASSPRSARTRCSAVGVSTMLQSPLEQPQRHGQRDDRDRPRLHFADATRLQSWRRASERCRRAASECDGATWRLGSAPGSFANCRARAACRASTRTLAGFTAASIAPSPRISSPASPGTTAKLTSRNMTAKAARSIRCASPHTAATRWIPGFLDATVGYAYDRIA